MAEKCKIKREKRFIVAMAMAIGGAAGRPRRIDQLLSFDLHVYCIEWDWRKGFRDISLKNGRVVRRRSGDGDVKSLLILSGQRLLYKKNY